MIAALLYLAGALVSPAPVEELTLCPNCCEWVELTEPATLESRDEREALLVAEYESRIAELERKLREERVRSMRREEKWLDFSKLMATLELTSEPVGPDPPVVAVQEASAPEPVDLEELERDRVLRRLKALVRVERVTSLEPLEVGLVQDGWTGPVVFRTLDEFGRPSGVLVAERFHLEGSIAARTLTLCFDSGYERVSGDLLPFDGTSALPVTPGPSTTMIDGAPARRGRRTIVLEHVDPRPWIEVLPKLFSRERRSTKVPDDGVHDSSFLRLTINRVLNQQPGSRSYRLVGLGGVSDQKLWDVLFEVVDSEGEWMRIFADTMSIREEDRGVSLRFEHGAVERGGRRAPFLDGRYRLFLTGVDPSTWREAGIPFSSP